MTELTLVNGNDLMTHEVDVSKLTEYEGSSIPFQQSPTGWLEICWVGKETCNCKWGHPTDKKTLQNSKGYTRTRFGVPTWLVSASINPTQKTKR